MHVWAMGTSVSVCTVHSCLTYFIDVVLSSGNVVNTKSSGEFPVCKTDCPNKVPSIYRVRTENKWE